MFPPPFNPWGQRILIKAWMKHLQAQEAARQATPSRRAAAASRLWWLGRLFRQQVGNRLAWRGQRRRSEWPVACRTAEIALAQQAVKERC